MSTPVFKIASATIEVDGKEIDLMQAMFPVVCLGEPDAIAATASRIIGAEITIRFVGELRFYPRRQVMLDLARYTRWPYTN